jgi:hypothetical protein
VSGMSHRESLEHKLERLLDAYKKTRKAELEDELIILDQLDDVGTVLVSPFYDDPDDTEAEHSKQSWKRTIEPLVEIYMDADWNDAVDIADVIDKAVFQLRVNSGVEEGSDPRTEIETNIAGWQGPASEVFRQTHLPQMDNALRYQHEMALALSDVIKTHGAIVKSAYFQAKDLMQHAREVLDEEAERLERESKEALRNFTNDLLQIAIAGEFGGPAKGVETALEKVGEHLATLEFHPQGKANDIMGDLESALRSLRRLIGDELEEIRHALNRCDDYLNGEFAEDFMPYPVPGPLRTGTL